MNIRDLKYLLAVAELQHFGKAAEKCFVSQPTLSMQLKKLEDSLGVKLIERDNKSVRITPIGKEIASIASNILTEVNNIHALADASKDPLAGEITIGIIPTIGPYLLPKIMPSISKKFAKLKIYLYEGKTEDIVKKLIDGELDVIILALPIKLDNLIEQHLYNENFLLAVPKEHSLAQRKYIKPHDLKGKQLLLLSEGHCFRDQALEFCHQANAHELTNFQATSLETLRQMVAANVGITLMPELACQQSHKSIVYVPFNKPQPQRKIGMLWRKTSVKKQLLQSILKVIKEKLKCD